MRPSFGRAEPLALYEFLIQGDKMERRIASRGIIYKDGKLLTVLHKESGLLAVPGGGLDPGEALYDNLVRELIEETGITPKVGKLLFIQQFTNRFGGEHLEFFFHIENPEDFEEIDLTNTTHGHLEIDELSFTDPKTVAVLPEFLRHIDIEEYITSTQPVYFHNELR